MERIFLFVSLYSFLIFRGLPPFDLPANPPDLIFIKLFRSHTERYWFIKARGDEEEIDNI